MQIAICDDDILWCKKAQQMISSHAKNLNLEVEITAFPDEKSLFSYGGPEPDALFLDIELGQNCGIEIAKEINTRWPHCRIVFASNYLHYATDVYETRHIYYVVKEQFAERLDSVLKQLCAQQNRREQTLSFLCTGKKVISLTLDEIYYFERSGRRTCLYTVYGTYELHDRIPDLLKQLPKNEFLRCHNSYLVNLTCIRELKTDTILTRTGAAIPISRHYQKSVKEVFADWAMKRME